MPTEMPSPAAISFVGHTVAAMHQHHLAPCWRHDTQNSFQCVDRLLLGGAALVSLLGQVLGVIAWAALRSGNVAGRRRGRRTGIRPVSRWLWASRAPGSSRRAPARRQAHRYTSIDWGLGEIAPPDSNSLPRDRRSDVLIHCGDQIWAWPSLPSRELVWRPAL